MSRTPRRFGLADLNIVIAATAVGFGISRWTYENVRYPPISSEDVILRRVTLPLAIDLLTPILAFWCLALLIFRIRSGGVRTRRLLREPGMVVVIATWAAVAACLLLEVVLISMPGPSAGMRFRRLRHAYIFLPTMISVAVASGWFALAMAGRWKPRASGIDRLGRAFGVVWIGMFLLGWLRFF